MVIYVFAELWGVVMLNLMFWQLANKICRTREAKKFYMMFGLIGNLGMIVAGELMMYFSNIAKHNQDISNNPVVVQIITAALFMALILTGLYRYVYTKIIPDPRYYLPAAEIEHYQKPNFTQSIKTIMTSKYLGLILALIICYGISINLIEGVWKAKVRELYPTIHEYMWFMGMMGKWIGIGTIASYIVGHNVLRMFGWLFTARITPVMMLVTGMGFFIFCLFQKHLLVFQGWIGYAPLTVAVFLGLLQNVLAKSTKYSLFDGVKEIAYIPLDDELKTKGKAVVDVLGSSIGKSSGSIILSSLFMIIPGATFNDLMPVVMVVFILILLSWLHSIKSLHKAYEALKAKSER